MTWHKFGAVRTERDGHTFGSKAEARYYDQLVMAQRTGLVAFFLRQVPFHLPGGVKYVADFLIFHLGGKPCPTCGHTGGVVEVVDVKGHETESFRAKKRQVEALYPVTIEVTK